MAKKKVPAKNNPGLGQASTPTLIKPNGERIVAQSELAQLQEKRDKVQADLDDLDRQLLELKKRRKEELLAELDALGLDVTPRSTSSEPSGKKKGRPKGVPMSETHKQALRDGRAKARARREADKQPTVG